MGRWLTVLLVVSSVGLVVYELLTAITRKAPTISGIVWYLSSRPGIPFAFGLLMGHFFL